MRKCAVLASDEPAGGRRRRYPMRQAKVAELVDALDLGSSGATRESSSLSFRTTWAVLMRVARTAFRGGADFEEQPCKFP